MPYIIDHDDRSVLRLTSTVAPDESLTCVLRTLNGILKQVPEAHRRRQMIAAGIVACAST